jgi:hypothetical protein
VIWDNRATMHRATPFADGKFRRELRRDYNARCHSDRRRLNLPGRGTASAVIFFHLSCARETRDRSGLTAREVLELTL